MKLLEERIRRDGQILEGNILKVGSFLNHQMDVELFREMGKELVRLYAGCGVNKILTIEASGIGIACIAALEFGCNAVFAKKYKTSNITDDVYTARVMSYTHGTEYNIIVDSAYDVNSIEEIFRYGDYVKRKNRAIGVISINYSDGDKRLEKIMELCNRYLDVSILTENESQDSSVMEILERCDRFERNGRILYMPMRSQAIENAIEIMNRNDTVLIIGKGNERFLSMGLGKEFYHGDKYYAVKFINKRRREENEIV